MSQHHYRWYEHKPSPYRTDGLFRDLKKIHLNDNNIKPPHIDSRVKNTEFWVRRGKKECVVAIGESWTFGEGLEDRVLSAQLKFDLDVQIANCWGPQVATLLETDFYQYAVPGNNNFTMFNAVERILEHLSHRYKTVYLLMQMTEPSREDIIINELSGHPLARLYDNEYLKHITVKDWGVENEDIFFRQLQKTILKYKNVKATAWKNFCTVQNTKDYGFKILQETWIEFSARATGYKVESPDFFVYKWIKNFLKSYSVKYDPKYLNEQLDKIEGSHYFLDHSSDHKPHPLPVAHRLWGHNVYNLMAK